MTDTNFTNGCKLEEIYWKGGSSYNTSLEGSTQAHSFSVFTHTLRRLIIRYFFCTKCYNQFNHSTLYNILSSSFFKMFRQGNSTYSNFQSLYVLAYFGVLCFRTSCHFTDRISVSYSKFQNIPLFCHSVVSQYRVAWTTCDFYCKTGFGFEEMFFCSSGSHNNCNVMPWYVRRKTNWKGRIHISTTCTVGFTAILLFQLLSRARVGFTFIPLLHLSSRVPVRLFFVPKFHECPVD